METQTVSENGNKNRYTTSRGYEIEFLGIGVQMQRLYQRHASQPPIPTYEVKNATGATEVHQHDETTLETEADKAAWAVYQGRLAEHAQKVFESQMRLALLEGIKLLSTPADRGETAWQDEQEFIGFEIPKNPLARKYAFLESEITATNDDVIAVLAGVSRASGMDEEAVSALEDGFRGAVGRTRGNAAEGTDPTDSADETSVERGEQLSGDGDRAGENETAAVAVASPE